MKKFLRILLWGFLLLVMAAFVLPMFGLAGAKVTGAALLGWLGFLRRVVPQITVSGSGFSMVVLCSGLIVAGTHWLFSWIYSHNHQTQQPEQPRWLWKWSFSIYAGLWLLFLAAMGVTGFVHQLGWLLSSKEPIIIERPYRGMPGNQMREAAMYLVTAAEDSDWNLTATRKGFLAESGRMAFRRRPAIEDLHVLFIPGKEEKLAAAIVFPREAGERDAVGFIVVSDKSGGREEPRLMRDLPEVLARYGSR